MSPVGYLPIANYSNRIAGLNAILGHRLGNCRVALHQILWP
ncbi:MAG TPA: hypothetical protein VFO39_16335 [Candidatus Sulfotelmatobacter sp.]|nr:hypothetical protein [Candidatus Sulfotelmatobacter sp.]